MEPRGSKFDAEYSSSTITGSVNYTWLPLKTTTLALDRTTFLPKKFVLEIVLSRSKDGVAKAVSDMATQARSLMKLVSSIRFGTEFSVEVVSWADVSRWF